MKANINNDSKTLTFTSFRQPPLFGCSKKEGNHLCGLKRNIKKKIVVVVIASLMEMKHAILWQFLSAVGITQMAFLSAKDLSLSLQCIWTAIMPLIPVALSPNKHICMHACMHVILYTFLCRVLQKALTCMSAEVYKQMCLYGKA